MRYVPIVFPPRYAVYPIKNNHQKNNDTWNFIPVQIKLDQAMCLQIASLMLYCWAHP